MKNKSNPLDVASSPKRTKVEKWWIQPKEIVYKCRAEVQSDVLALWNWLIKEKVPLNPGQVVIRIVKLEALDTLTMLLHFASYLDLETLKAFCQEYADLPEAKEIHRIIETLEIDQDIAKIRQ